MQMTKDSRGLRLRVIALFFSGLLFLALLAVGIGWVFGDCCVIRFGWLNPILGCTLVVSGFALVVWTVRLQYVIGKGTPAPQVPTQRLLTNGPYAHTRNPMTLGALLLYLGIGIWMGSGVVIILTVIIFSVLLKYIHSHETQELAERFGDEYLEYQKRTPFLLPCGRRQR
jgi:protein-S-isoprenylcysteine O-methyltransferase Ste14